MYVAFPQSVTGSNIRNTVNKEIPSYKDIPIPK